MSIPGRALECRLLSLPRQGHDALDLQDAAAADVERGRFALADGAGESSFAALWARLLVEELVRQDTPAENLSAWLSRVQQRWQVEVGRSTHGADLPWFLEAGISQGAFATFLALRLEARSWQAVAVGDSCLFQVRDEALLRSFPLTRAVDFTPTPWLVGSRTAPGEGAGRQALQMQGDWQPHDRLLLVTDALAQWVFLQVEQGRRPWGELADLLEADEPEAAFAGWIDRLRRGRELRNDDVTLLALLL